LSLTVTKRLIPRAALCFMDGEEAADIEKTITSAVAAYKCGAATGFINSATGLLP
jgi:hypothetical protein